MATDKQSVGATALSNALALASKHASTAAVAAALVPLAMAAAPSAAHAATYAGAAIGLSVTDGIGPDGSNLFAYTVTNNSAFGVITTIEIPEVAAGALVASSGLPSGWTAAEYSTTQFPSGSGYSSLSSGIAADFLDLTGDFQMGIAASGGALTFDLYSFSDSTISGTATVDITDPDPIVASAIDTPAIDTPEPASMAILGTALVGLVGLRRRKTR